MSTFGVTVERIGQIKPAQNADRLELATLEGKDYEFVVGKGSFSPGELVVYFPVDSELPAPLIEALELTGKLAHGTIPTDGTPRPQNRVKTIKLRGNLSQGVVAKFAVVQGFLKNALSEIGVGMNLAHQLGVTKYEPPVVPSKGGNLVPLPELVSVYDIESAQNYTDLVERLMDEPVLITEKLEGAHWAATLYNDMRLVVSQRRYAIDPIPGGAVHDWWKVLYAQGLDRLLASLQTALKPKQCVTIRGEIVGPGVQGNYYGLSDHRVYPFEIEVDGAPIDAREFLRLSEAFNFATVPIIWLEYPLTDWLDGDSLKDASTDISVVNPKKLREGIVIRPMAEQRDEQLGRVILKVRSPEYLAKSEF